MKFGIAFANTMHLADGGPALEFVSAAEKAGFESVWAIEHVVYPEDYVSAYPYDPSGQMPVRRDSPVPDPLIWLAHVSAVTHRIRLGTGVMVLPQRNPIVLAKEVATLDHLSGGRMELGIGVGWLREEFEALGVPWERRGARTDDYVAAMRALWAGDRAEHHGEFVDFTGVSSNPKPLNGSVPIVVGGNSEVAARRAGRLGDGFFPGPSTGDELRHLVAIVRQTAEDHGRDPELIEVTAPMPNLTDGADQLRELGVDRAVVSAFAFLGLDRLDKLAEFGAETIAAGAAR